MQSYSCEEPLRDADTIADCLARDTSTREIDVFFGLRLNKKCQDLISIDDYRSLSSMVVALDFGHSVQHQLPYFFAFPLVCAFFPSCFLARYIQLILYLSVFHQCFSLVFHLFHFDSDHLDADCTTEILPILSESQWRKNRLNNYCIRRLCHSTSSKGPLLFILLCGRHKYQRIEMFWIPYVTSSYFVAKIS